MSCWVMHGASTSEQSHDGQSRFAALRQCRADLDRRGLQCSGEAALADPLEVTDAGDMVVVCRLDRLCRLLPELLELVETVTARGVGLRLLAEQLDTSSAAG